MTALVAAVFVSSLVGSAHCAAMCGGFACLATSGTAGAWRQAAGAQAAYHGGRLVSYLLLGALAGTAGGFLDDGALWLGLQRGAAVAASVLIIGWGLALLAEQRGLRLPLPAPLAPMQRRLGALLAALADRPPTVRGAALGLLTTALPCGWLYAFVVTAGGTGAPVPAMAVMAVFWLGTLPALAALGAGVHRLSASMRRRLPQVAALALVAVGIVSLVRRPEHARAAAHAMGRAAPHGAALHGEAAHGAPAPGAVGGHQH